jgi:predicted glycosyltransferase
MAGYNTICELLTLGKRSIIVPRVKPVEEQKIRAERMAKVPFFRTILPDALGPVLLANTMMEQLQVAKSSTLVDSSIDLGALPRISAMLAGDAGRCTVSSFAFESKPLTEMVS